MIRQKKKTEVQISDDDEPVPDTLPKTYNNTCIDAVIRNPAWLFVFWDIKDQEWGCCTNTRAKQLFNRIDLENLEEQFLQKYGYRFGNDTPKAVADQWTKFRNEKKKERKQSL